MSRFKRHQVFTLLTELYSSRNCDTDRGDRLPFRQHLVTSSTIFPLACQHQRNKFPGPQRLEPHVVEFLFVVGKNHVASFQIYARDLVEINGREYQCPENRRPEHGILKEKIRDVSKRGGNRKPSQPQNVS